MMTVGTISAVPPKRAMTNRSLAGRAVEYDFRVDSSLASPYLCALYLP